MATIADVDTGQVPGAPEQRFAAVGEDHVSDETGPDDPDVVDSAELDLVEEALADVETALERLADGSYGTCEVCSRKIADDQLLRDPTARRCAEHLPLPAG